MRDRTVRHRAWPVNTCSRISEATKNALSFIVQSVPYASFKGSLAQLVEQLAFNQLVAGSNPARPTTHKKAGQRPAFLWVVGRVVMVRPAGSTNRQECRFGRRCEAPAPAGRAPRKARVNPARPSTPPRLFYGWWVVLSWFDQPVRQIGRSADLDAGAKRRRPQGERHGRRESIQHDRVRLPNFPGLFCLCVPSKALRTERPESKIQSRGG